MQRVHSSDGETNVVFGFSWQQISLHSIRELQEKDCTPLNVIRLPVSIRFKSDMTPDGRFCFLLFCFDNKSSTIVLSVRSPYSGLMWLCLKCNVTPATQRRLQEFKTVASVVWQSSKTTVVKLRHVAVHPATPGTQTHIESTRAVTFSKSRVQTNLKWHTIYSNEFK